MQLRRFDSLCLISFACLVLTLALIGVSFATNPWDHRISFAPDFHVGVWNARIVFFNDPDYGPYHGSMIHLGDGAGGVIFKGGIRARPVLDRFWSVWEYGFVKKRYVNSEGVVMETDTACDLPGIYYRNFRGADGALWTLMESLAYPAVIFSVLPLIWSALRLKQRHRPTPTRPA